MSEQERLAAESALEALKNSTDEMVTAAQIAPILHMNPGVIVKYAKDGTWIQDNMGKFIISGDRVKFFRRDFLQKCGFIPKDEPNRTVEDLLQELIEVVRVQNTMLIEMGAYIKKTAGAATPTE
jgi:hypothetical protein